MPLPIIPHECKRQIISQHAYGLLIGLVYHEKIDIVKNFLILNYEKKSHQKECFQKSEKILEILEIALQRNNTISHSYS